MNWEIFIQITVAGVQILALYIAYKLAIKQHRMLQASRYLERLLSPEMIDAREVVDRWHNIGDLSEKLAWLDNPEHSEDLAHIRAFANYFQELGIAWERGLVDQNYIRDIFDVLSCRYWNRLAGWIQAYRNSSDPSLYSKWESLRNDLCSKKSNLKNEI